MLQTMPKNTSSAIRYHHSPLTLLLFLHEYLFSYKPIYNVSIIKKMEVIPTKWADLPEGRVLLSGGGGNSNYYVTGTCHFARKIGTHNSVNSGGF